LCLGLALLAAGCAQRRMTIRTNPPGAAVYVDDYPIGTTPVSTNFTYYGTRKIRLVKDGYETLTVLQPVKTPWYDFFGLDFVSENIIPGEIRDQQQFCYQLRPQAVVPTEQLMGRAEELRRQAPGNAPLPVPAPEAVPAPPPAGGMLPNLNPRNLIPPSPPPLPPSPGQQTFTPPGALPPGPPPEVGSQPLHPLPPSGATGL
jgi:hypothetical protein